MNALQNLNTSVTALTASVDAAVAKLGQPSGVPEADVQAAADQVNAQVIRLNTASGVNATGP